MSLEHRARITWSPTQVDKGLPAVTQMTAPSWFVPAASNDEGWSLICRFETAPEAQGNPSVASVRFMVAGAPHERLVPGTVLRLFEHGTGQQATVEVIE